MESVKTITERYEDVLVETSTDITDYPDLFEDTETGEFYYIELDEETLEEQKFIIKVNSKGRRTRKLRCGKGRVVKTVNGRKVCVVQQGSARVKKRLAIRRANRTKKAKGTGYKNRINRKRQRAVRRRAQMGLMNRKRK